MVDSLWLLLRKIVGVQPLWGGLLGELEKKLGWGGCANGDRFAILVYVAGVTQLVE